MDIRGGYAKPNYSDILWIQLVLLPYSTVRYIHWSFSIVYFYCTVHHSTAVYTVHLPRSTGMYTGGKSGIYNLNVSLKLLWVHKLVHKLWSIYLYSRNMYWYMSWVLYTCILYNTWFMMWLHIPVLKVHLLVHELCSIYLYSRNIYWHMNYIPVY